MINFDTLNNVIGVTGFGLADFVTSIQSIITSVIDNPELGDEIYCQICKQLNGNTKE